jgi:hypothetical protein
MNPTQYSVFQKACPPRDLDSTTSWKTQHTKNISSLSATDIKNLISAASMHLSCYLAWIQHSDTNDSVGTAYFIKLYKCPCLSVELSFNSAAYTSIGI